MMDSFDSLVINLKNDKSVYYVNPEFSENVDRALTNIRKALVNSKLDSNEINYLWEMIDDYVYYRSRITYEYGFKASADLFGK